MFLTTSRTSSKFPILNVEKEVDFGQMLTTSSYSPFFRGSDKCVVQPHLGSFTDRAWKDAYLECMENIEAFYRDGKPISPVNEF